MRDGGTTEGIGIWEWRLSGFPANWPYASESIEGIQRWINCTRRASFSLCLSCSLSFSFSFSSALELELEPVRIILVGDDIESVRDRSAVAGRDGSAAEAAGVPERTAGVIGR